MERSTKKNGLINFAALLLLAAAGYAVARLTNSLAGQVATAIMGLGVLVAAVSWFQMRLEDNERLEKLEFDELARTRGGTALFETKDAESFPAQRAREQFERFFVPIFTGLLFVGEGLGAFFLWRWVSSNTMFIQLSKPISMAALALFGLLALVLFLLGKFSATIARLENHRLLRPSASWLLLSAYLCFVVALGIVGVETGFVRTDFYVAQVLCGLLAVLAFETLVALILEIYRPRLKGKVSRPIYDSRLVGLLGHPEGLVTTAAQALDYQFGFKVSETWFFQVLQRYFVALILFQLAVLLLSTCVVFIDPGEQALLERFGRPVEGRHLLGPGAHAKWPWPIDRVYYYRAEQIQSFNIGFTPDPKTENQPVVLWKVEHTKEENFLVANRETAVTAQATNSASGRRAPPVSLLTVSIPVQFQIRDLHAWVYNNENPTNLLQNVATREVVRYLVNADLDEVMSRERSEAAETLRQRIQGAADEHKLGATIVFVGLQDIHPPVKVAADYEKVISASHQMQSNILAAQAFTIRTNALAEAQATNLVDQALAFQVTRQIGAFAQAALFTNQIPAFQAAPQVYIERNYLQTFGRATAQARKYIVLSTNTDDVFVIDLQDKIRDDLLNVGVGPKN